MKSIIFDDLAFDGHGCWTQICKSCIKNLSDLGFLDEAPLEGLICGVSGCQNKAYYYLDVNKSNEK